MKSTGRPSALAALSAGIDSAATACIEQGLEEEDIAVQGFDSRTVRWIAGSSLPLCTPGSPSYESFKSA